MLQSWWKRYGVWKDFSVNLLISLESERNSALFIPTFRTSAILARVSPAGTPIMTVVCGEEPALG